MAAVFPDDEWLQDEAGSAAFGRGQGYHARGRIVLHEASESSLAGQAFGSETYSLWMKREADGWGWDCDCPAADGGVFCKHLVAAVLTARDGAIAKGGKRPLRKASTAEEVSQQEFLHAQPQQRLADWLHRLSLQEPAVDRFLHLQRAAEDPQALKAVLAKLLTAGSLLDYRLSMDFASRLDPALEQLRELLPRDPAGCLALSEYAFKRLARLIERCDDSAGAIGDRMREVGELHAGSANAGATGKGFAAKLHALQCLDQWGMLALERYWPALDARERATYAKKVLDEFEALTAPRTGRFDGGYNADAYAVCARSEALARCTGDFDLLQRVLRRDLSHPHQHLRVLDSLSEAGREREALAWAETAVKRFPDDGRLRSALADCLAAAGLVDEAIEQDWLVFRQHPAASCWDALRRRAATDWPQWRERALAHVAARENGHASLRVLLLVHDGDIATAAALAQQHLVTPDTLLMLAERVQRSDPDAAGAFFLRTARHYAESLQGPRDYTRLTACLANAARLAPEAQWRPLLSELRETHRRKTRLMGELDAAGLR